MRRRLQLLFFLLMLGLVSILTIPLFAPAPAAPIVMLTPLLSTPDTYTFEVITLENVMRLEEVYSIGIPDGRFSHPYYFPTGRLISTLYEEPGYVNLNGIRGKYMMRHFSDQKLALSAVAFTPDGEMFVSRGYDRKKPELGPVLLVNMVEQGGEMYRLEGYRDLAFSPTGQVALYYEGDNPHLQIWSGLDGHHIQTLDVQNVLIDHGLRYTLDGQFLIVRTLEPAEVIIFRAGTGQEVLRRLQLRTYALSPDTRLIALGRYQGGMEIWSVEHQALLKTMDTPRNATVQAQEFMPDGQRLLITFSEGQSLYTDVYTWQSGEMLFSFGKDRPHIFTPDGRLMISASAQSLRFWDTNTYALISTYEMALRTEDTRMVVMGPDGRTIAVEAQDESVKILAVVRP